MWIRKYLKYSSNDVGAGGGADSGGGAPVTDSPATEGSDSVTAPVFPGARWDAGAQVGERESSAPGETVPQLEPLSTEVVSAVEEAFQAIGLPHDVLESARAWMDKGIVKSQDELDAIDAVDRKSAETELKALWGPKFKENIKAINKYVRETLKPGVADVIQYARTADGHAIANKPDVLQSLLGPALKARPTDLTGDAEEQIEKIERFMRTNRAAYNQDEPLQSLYRQLLEKRLEKV